VAIYLAVKWAESNQELEKVVIFSDSSTALKTLSSREDGSSVKTSIINAWLKMRQAGRHISFAWVKAHSGVPGNEQADQTAKSGLSLAPSISCRVNGNDMREKVDRFYIKEWQTSWNQPTTACGRFVNHHSPRVSRRPSFFGSSRKEQVFLLRLRLDVLPLNHRLFKIKKHQTGTCGNCGMQKQENVEHILLECPAYEGERDDLAQTLGKDHLSLQKLLDFNHTATLDAVLGFFRASGIKSRLGF
jgi:hypothetical protein